MNNYNLHARLYRMFPPSPETLTTIMDRSFSAPDGFLDVPHADAELLGCAGWTPLCETGPTSARPTLGVAADVAGATITIYDGQRYYDTTLGEMLTWHSSKREWVDTEGQRA